MEAVHWQVLASAQAVADPRTGAFRLVDLVAALPALNPGTIRTHVASRCCVNAPKHHQSRHPYFRSVARGVYRIEPRFRRRRTRRRVAWDERIIDRLPAGIDATLVAESLAWSPTERLERMRGALRSLGGARRA